MTTPGLPTDPAELADAIVRRTQAAAAEWRTQAEGAPQETDVLKMLRVALRNELEASELAAMWMPSTADIELKVLLARHCGDEAQHFEQVRRRLRELGATGEQLLPAPGMPTPLLTYLASLKQPAERVAAGFVVRETIALEKNAQFVVLCRELGDTGTARLYDEVIQPDERAHRDQGVALLLRYLGDAETRGAVAGVAERTLSIAGALTITAAKEKGLGRAPGC